VSFELILGRKTKPFQHQPSSLLLQTSIKV